MDEVSDDYPQMDASDIAWVNQFIDEEGGSENPRAIQKGSVIDGFVAVISWTTPEGQKRWRSYNTIDSPLSTVLGLLEMTQYQMMVDNTERG